MKEILLPMSPVVQNKKDHSSHFEALLEEAAIGILIINEKGAITAINPFALRDFGFAEDELLGQKIEKLIPVRRDLVHKVSAYNTLYKHCQE